MSERDDEIFILTLILNFIIILITFYLIFLYFKSKNFYSYPCLHILNLSLTLCVDNAVRLFLFPNSWSQYKILQYFQAFILASLDKFILLVLTSQVFIIYVGIMKTEFYFSQEKAIFLSSFIISLGISLIIGGLYLLFGIVKYGIYYYPEGNNIKTILDTIFNSVFLFFDTLFCVVVIINMIIKNDSLDENIMNNDDNESSLMRIILIFFANSIFFIESFLLIYDKLSVPDDFIDLVYLTTCLLVNLVYAINKKVIKETKKLFCKCKQKIRINTYESRSLDKFSHRTDTTSYNDI